MRQLIASAVIAVVLGVTPALAQITASDWAAVVGNEYRVIPNITYLTASNWEAKLDVYRPAAPGPHPVVLHIHGGGWVGGTREGTALRALPFLEMGYAVVNISYRLGRVAPAPAAVEDCLCALRWIARNAKEYDFDLTRIVTTGYSAGGHLALTTGMIPASAGLDRQCPYTHATRLHAALQSAGVTSELVTIPKGGHGGFPRAEQLRAVAAMRAFLAKHRITQTATSSQP